jgi:lipopolysaccharide export LptBFGC system permease protein LptF
MKTLDRYVARSFLFCCLVVFLVFMGLRIIGDLFVNMDEFVKGDRQFLEVLGHVVNYYGAQSLVYITELGGVTVTFGAAFTLARMNKSNELTAMLASGVSLYRVLLPILVGSIGLVGLIVVDREVLIPRIAPRLAVDRGERAETETYQVRLMPDERKSVWYAVEFHPTEGLMKEMTVVIRSEAGRRLGLVSAEEATAGPLAGYGEGWHARQAKLVGSQDEPWPRNQSSTAIYSQVDPQGIQRRAHGGTVPADPTAVADVELVDDIYGMRLRADRFVPEPGQDDQLSGRLIEPQFAFYAQPEPLEEGAEAPATVAEPKLLAVVHATQARWDASRRCWELTDGAVFVPSDLSPADILLRQSGRWTQYVSFARLGELIDQGLVSNDRAALMSRHLRITEPLNTLMMLLLPMTFILSRERNVKASVGMSVLVVGVFYISTYMIRYVDNIPAVWAAWIPTLVFGPIAVALLDNIKT